MSRPHRGGGTVETRRAMEQLVRGNLAAHFAGRERRRQEHRRLGARRPVVLDAPLSGGRAGRRIPQELGAGTALRDETPTGRTDDMLEDNEAVWGFAGADRLVRPVTSPVSDLHRRSVAAGIGGAGAAAAMRQLEGRCSSTVS